MTSQNHQHHCLREQYLLRVVRSLLLIFVLSLSLSAKAQLQKNFIRCGDSDDLLGLGDFFNTLSCNIDEECDCEDTVAGLLDDVPVDVNEPGLSNEILQWNLLHHDVFRPLGEVYGRYEALFGEEGNQRLSRSLQPRHGGQFCGLDSIEKIKQQLLASDGCADKEDQVEQRLKAIFTAGAQSQLQNDESVNAIAGLLDAMDISEAEKNRAREILQNPQFDRQEKLTQLGEDFVANFGVLAAKNPSYASGAGSERPSCFENPRHLEYLTSLPTLSEMDEFLNIVGDNDEGMNNLLMLFKREKGQGHYAAMDNSKLMSLFEKEPLFKAALKMDQQTQLEDIKKALGKLRTHLQEIRSDVAAIEGLESPDSYGEQYLAAVNSLKDKRKSFYDLSGDGLGEHVEAVFDGFCRESLRHLRYVTCNDDPSLNRLRPIRMAHLQQLRPENQELYHLMSCRAKSQIDSEVESLTTDQSYASRYDLIIPSSEAMERASIGRACEIQSMSGPQNDHVRSVCESMGASVNEGDQGGQLENLCQMISEQFSEDEQCATNPELSGSSCRKLGLQRIFASSPSPGGLDELLSHSSIRRIIGLEFATDLSEDIDNEDSFINLAANHFRGGLPVSRQGAVGRVSSSAAGNSVGAAFSPDISSAAVAKKNNLAALPSAGDLKNANNASSQGPDSGQSGFARAQNFGGSNTVSNQQLASAGARGQQQAQNSQTVGELNNDNRELLNRIRSLEEQLANARAQGASASDPQAPGNADFLAEEIRRLREQVASNERTIASINNNQETDTASQATIPYAPSQGQASQGTSSQQPSAQYGPSPGMMPGGMGMLPDGSMPFANQDMRSVQGQRGSSRVDEAAQVGDQQTAGGYGLSANLDEAMAMRVSRGEIQVVQADQGYIEQLRMAAESGNQQQFLEYLQELGVSDEAFLVQDPNDTEQEFLVNWSQQEGRIVMESQRLGQEVEVQADRAPANIEQESAVEEEVSSDYYRQLNQEVDSILE